MNTIQRLALGGSLATVALAQGSAMAQTSWPIWTPLRPVTTVPSASTTSPTAPSTNTPSPTAPSVEPAIETSAKPLKPLYRNVRAFYRNVRAFWGDVNPFYRNVRAFWGDVDPFYRNVRAFWGTMDPAQLAMSAGAPAYAGVGPFWEGLGGQWDLIAGSWQKGGDYNLLSAPRYALISAQLKTMVATSEGFWGSAVRKKSGQSFNTAFADPMLSRFGISLSNPSSLAKLDAATQSQFFIEWYDGLMTYSGTDHADWWMKSINWTPKLTQTMGAGEGSILGLVDDYAATSMDIRTQIKDLTKKNPSAGGHGEGVLSLVISAHDGKGVMGIAPRAKVIGYNPFDATGSAEWSDVANGIQAVASNGATVINLSLGAPGVTLSPEWQTIFTKSEINSHKDKTLYIIAAGNDGVSQSGIVDMKGALDTTFIVVGSAGPTGISEFSNRPGDTCLTDGGTECKASTSLKESGYLMNRFIVAPGELILVSDGAGGLTRQSGTSLSAPLVAGTVALIQDRWPWMREKPRDIAMVILGSATDMGAPGIDPVYGVGMLNAEGAMSPLNFSNLKYYLTSSSGTSQNEVSVTALRSQGLQSSWATNNMYFTAFEKLDQVERDFLIPLSSRLYGTTRGGEYFQDFVYNRMVNWINGTNLAGQTPGFTDGVQSAPAEINGWRMQMTGRLVTPFDSEGRAYQTRLRSTMRMVSPSGKLGFSMGNGDGAVALGGGQGFSLASDFDPRVGGANPLLGFASGGTHAAAEIAVSSALDVRAGFTERRQSRKFDLAGMIDANTRSGTGELDRYRADAMSVEVGYKASSWLRISGAATTLREPNAVLGVRALNGTDLAGGSRTQSFTMGAHADLGSGFTLSGTATSARAKSPQSDASLRIGSDGLTGNSFQFGLGKVGLLGKQDGMRLTIAQPLRLDGGAIELTERQVIDRQTGETGVLTQRFDIGAGQPRRLVVEGTYAAPVFDGQGQVSLFGRGEMGDLDVGTPRVMFGSQMQLAF